jgi:iron complex transport system ATP-binding protein
VRLAAGRIVVRHGSRTVLDGVDLAFGTGELVLLAGRNGAGKSTLLRVLLGVQTATSGEVRLADRRIEDWPARERARTVAFVPQAADCPFEFTGRELVEMGRYPHRGPRQPMRAADAEAIEAALAAVDATGFAAQPVATLSGGELRRIAVARALATASPLLLLDEPTANLDLEHALEVAALMRRLAGDGRGVLVAAHDLNLLAPHAHRVVLLHQGRVHADGRPEDVLDEATFAAVFGVSAETPTAYFPRAFRPRRG